MRLLNERTKMNVMVSLLLALVILGSSADRAYAALVTQLDFTSGAVNWTGPQGRILDRLFDQDGLILTGQYQPLGQIVDSITQGHKTYSLFTSGLNGAPAPSGTISGNAIVMDLSSLFFGWQRGDQIHSWNIGGQATGLFNPQTSEFSLSWDHVFANGKQDHNGKLHNNGMPEWAHGRAATFFLQGTAIIEAAPIPIPASLVLYGTGLFGLGSWSWLRRRWQSLPIS